MSRVVSLWLPTFATDRLTRPGTPRAGWRDDPCVTLRRDDGRQRLAAVNALAAGLGLTPGLALADARARVPDLRALVVDPAAEDRDLDHLADWCDRFTPLVARDQTDGAGAGGFAGGAGLWLEVTGCARLFGGEDRLVATILAAVRGLGFAARLGLADTPGAAWAAARFLAGCEEDPDAVLVPAGAQRQVMSGLPVAALRLPPAVCADLDRLGLRRIEALARLPRAALTRRLGPTVLARLDQLWGDAPEPLSPRRPAPRHRLRQSFAEPLVRPEGIAAALRRLLAALCREMDARQEGARSLCVTAFRVDGSLARFTLGTARPSRDPAHLALLARERLAGLDPGFGIETLVVDLRAADRLSPRQVRLDQIGPVVPDHGEAAVALADWVDRVTVRLAPEGGPAVVRPCPVAGLRPEAAVREAPALTRPQPDRWPPTAVRPVRLFTPPLPARVDTDASGAPQRLALTGGHLGQVIRWRDGPERLSPDWWQNLDHPPPQARTYWRVETEDGCRVWLVRVGRAWFLHGLFP